MQVLQLIISILSSQTGKERQTDWLVGFTKKNKKSSRQTLVV